MRNTCKRKLGEVLTIVDDFFSFLSDGRGIYLVGILVPNRQRDTWEVLMFCSCWFEIGSSRVKRNTITFEWNQLS